MGNRKTLRLSRKRDKNRLSDRHFNTFFPEKVSKDGVFSGPYFPVFSLNARKYGPEKTPYLDTFHAVLMAIEITYNIAA